MKMSAIFGFIRNENATLGKGEITCWYRIGRHGTGSDGHHRQLHNVLQTGFYPLTELTGDQREVSKLNWFEATHGTR